VVPIAFDAPAAVPWLGVIRDSLVRSFSVYVWRMPVSTPPARDAGVSLAGFPKELADIRFRHVPNITSCEVTMDGVPAVALYCPSVALRRPAACEGTGVHADAGHVAGQRAARAGVPLRGPAAPISHAA